jgi:hypothetical protein
LFPEAAQETLAIDGAFVFAVQSSIDDLSHNINRLRCFTYSQIPFRQ